MDDEKKTALIWQMNIARITMVDLAIKLHSFGRHDKAKEVTGACDMIDEWIIDIKEEKSND